MHGRFVFWPPTIIITIRTPLSGPLFRMVQKHKAAATLNRRLGGWNGGGGFPEDTPLVAVQTRPTIETIERGQIIFT